VWDLDRVHVRRRWGAELPEKQVNQPQSNDSVGIAAGGDARDLRKAY
jgi:hypothetical protein